MRSVTRSIVCKSALTLFFLLIFTMAATGCQDHHWVPYEEMGPVTAPAKRLSNVIVSGKVELDQDEGHAEWTLYIIARSVDKSSLLAAIKAVNVKFPHSFTITDKNIMFGEPAAGINYSVEARFDSDGDPDTKHPDDLIGKHNGELPLGAENAVIKLERRSG